MTQETLKADVIPNILSLKFKKLKSLEIGFEMLIFFFLKNAIFFF